MWYGMQEHSDQWSLACRAFVVNAVRDTEIKKLILKRCLHAKVKMSDFEYILLSALQLREIEIRTATVSLGGLRFSVSISSRWLITLGWRERHWPPQALVSSVKWRRSSEPTPGNSRMQMFLKYWPSLPGLGRLKFQGSSQRWMMCSDYNYQNYLTRQEKCCHSCRESESILRQRQTNKKRSHACRKPQGAQPVARRSLLWRNLKEETDTESNTYTKYSREWGW